MELVDAPAPPRAGAARIAASTSRPPSSPRPPELRDLMAATNAAATIPSGDDYAIWEDACRRLAAEKNPAPLRAAPTPGPRTVFVAEGVRALRETMRQTLVAAGYSVVSLDDATNVLTAAREHQADLIVLAIDLPGSDGLGLVNRLRALPAHRCTPIMMLITPAHEGKKIAARRAGASGWISKPFEPSRFVAIIQQVCPAN